MWLTGGLDHCRRIIKEQFYIATKVIGWIIQVLEYVDISCNGAKMYVPVYFCFSDLLYFEVVWKVSPDVVDIKSILLCICCVHICSAGYVKLPIVLLYLNYTKRKKTRFFGLGEPSFGKIPKKS